MAKMVAVVLPDDCWELVFRFLAEKPHDLENLSLVSKQFLAVTNRLRSTLRLSLLTVEDFPQIFKRFPFVKQIDIKEFLGHPDNLLLRIAKSGLNLERLDISRQFICFPRKIMRLLGSRMKNLRSLNCSSITFMEDDDLISIAESFPNLEDLDISYPGFRIATGSCTTGVTDHGIVSLSLILKHLQRINISDNGVITDESIVALSANCAFLTEIFFEDCERITRKGICEALSLNPKLNSLSLTTIEVLLPATKFIAAFVGLKNLSTLSMMNIFISDEFLRSMADESFPLKKLFLPKCTGYTFAGISVLLEQNRKIEMLNLAFTDFLTDVSVVQLSEFLPCLTFINLSHCQNLTTIAFLALARNCSKLNDVIMEETPVWRRGAELRSDLISSRIKYLDISGISICTGYMAKKISIVCPNLEHLRLSSISYFNDDIKYLQLPALQVLDLSSSSISDEELGLMGDNFPSLLHLNLSKCCNVTGRGVKEIVEKCRKLRSINIRTCEKVDYMMVPWIVESSSSLKMMISPFPPIPTLVPPRCLKINECLILKSRYDNRTSHLTPKQFNLFSSSYI